MTFRNPMATNQHEQQFNMMNIGETGELGSLRNSSESSKKQQTNGSNINGRVSWI